MEKIKLAWLELVFAHLHVNSLQNVKEFRSRSLA